MTAIIIICATIFIASVALLVGWAHDNIPDWGGIISLFLAIITGTGLVVCIVIDEGLQPKEFKASDFTLEYKATEYQGQMDTTYVLTPKTK
jgi:hypothetical protein